MDVFSADITIGGGVPKKLKWNASGTPRAAYGLPSDANYWFPEFSAGHKAFGGALAG